MKLENKKLIDCIAIYEALQYTTEDNLQIIENLLNDKTLSDSTREKIQALKFNIENIKDML